MLCHFMVGHAMLRCAILCCYFGLFLALALHAFPELALPGHAPPSWAESRTTQSLLRRSGCSGLQNSLNAVTRRHRNECSVCFAAHYSFINHTGPPGALWYGSHGLGHCSNLPKSIRKPSLVLVMVRVQLVIGLGLPS